MASSITSPSKSLCITCNKKQAFFTCRGCRQGFCEDHINEHHQEPAKQMDNFILDHKQLQQLIYEYSNEPHEHPLIKQIDKWEQQSINKIHQAANEGRTQVLNVISHHIESIKKSLENLTQQLDQIRNDDKLAEIYLKEYRDKLDQLKNDLITPETIQLRKDDDVAFISKLILIIVEPDDLFERSAGNVRIQDNGQMITHCQWSDHSSVRGKSEYSFGQHRFRFKIEELDSDKWAFVGIVSKNAPMKEISISTPTSYGFAGQDGVCRNGIYQNRNVNGYKSDMEMNDILELFIDCDHQIIRLINERTHSTHELNIDVNKCPFPWQILFGLCCSAGDRIRILPCTYKE